MTSTETTALVCADKWPATITTPAGITEVARVVLTVADDEHPAELWAWSPSNPEPTVLVRAEWHPGGSSVPIDGSGTWTVATHGGAYIVRPGMGCGGCHSVMGSWQPWHPYQWAARMPETMWVP